jgi:hypothetical protein
MKNSEIIKILKIIVPYMHNDTSPKAKADYSLLRGLIDYFEKDDNISNNG